METVSPAEAERLLESLEAMPLNDLLARARDMRRAGHGKSISYSRKVFILLTYLCWMIGFLLPNEDEKRIPEDTNDEIAERQ